MQTVFDVCVFVSQKIDELMHVLLWLQSYTFQKNTS
jgi:hypothetical protein